MKIFVSVAGPDHSSTNPIELALKAIMESNSVIQVVNSSDEAEVLLTDDVSQALRFLKDGDETKVLIAILPGWQREPTRSGAISLAKAFAGRVYARPLVDYLGEQNIVFFLLNIEEEMK
ncbi:MAG: hypothetical protein KA034_01690 [Candidatus Moranbacteria bacterium]|nr:hypothetical protein [Candidatus Moranbacteria bacterium]